MLKRAGEESRPDSSTEEQIKTRLVTYHEHTAPVLAYFKERGKLEIVDGMGTPEEVEEAIRKILA